MTGKKSRLFPFFHRKSAKTDSSANAHPAQKDEIVPEVGSSLTSDPPSLADAGRDKVAEKLRDHAERARKVAEQYNERIRQATEGLNEESDVADLYDAFKLISELSDFIQKKKQDKKEKKIKENKKEKEKKKKGKEEENNRSGPKLAMDSWIRSKNLKTLKEVLSEGIDLAKEFASSGDAKKMVQGFLKDIGGGHVFNIAFIVVANAWERYEDMSKNEEACLSLLKEINELAKIVIKLQKVLQDDPESKKWEEDVVKEPIELIIETCIACCTQIEASKRRSYFGTAGCRDELARLEKQLQPTYNRIELQMQCVTLAVGIKKPVQLRKPDYPEYPQDAVGIEDPLKEVIERLEMKSDKRAVAVILHGFGGMGKTTLANAVFARLFEEKTEGCKFSFVELFQDIKSTPIVVDLQKCILRDLKGDEPDEIRSYAGGRKQIQSILEEEEAFIYIDNVLLPDDTREQGQDALTRLLPEDMANAKKLRLLITTRDKDAARMTMSKGVVKNEYPIESLPKPKAVELLKKELSDNKNKLNASQIDGIANICGGVPVLLKVLAGFINDPERNAVENYETLMEEAKEKTWEGGIGKTIEKCIFAYDKLEDKWKDPFLDICSFFQGWDWEELSDIVGKPALEKLEQRALVTQHVKSMTARVHDVILEVGLTRTKKNRFRLTTATEIEEFLNIEDEYLQKIKGIWASDNKGRLSIPASKLDLMSGSLRVLKLGPSTDVEGKCEKKFEELVFFSAITSHVPFYVSKLEGFKKLRHLCYNTADLQNLSQMPPYLRHVDINLNSPAFQVSSNCIQRLKYLRVLRLSNAQFKWLPQELGDMGNDWEEVSISGCRYLEELSISGCQYLQKVSISTLKSLRVLRMDGCSGLTQLAKGLASLTSLQELSLDGCKSLEALPSELENLTSLQKLDLRSCQSLKALPSSLGKLTSLQELSLYSCKSLQALPNNLEGLSLLRLLDLTWCKNIKNLPCGIENLTSLVELKLSSCGLSSIPDNIGMLKLNSIKLNWNYNLKKLPEGFCNLSTLTELDMHSCHRLKKLPKRFGEVTSLRKLMLISCNSLKNLPESFCQLVNLEHLDLSKCWTLKELCKDIKGLSRLRVLSLEHCQKLKTLPVDFHCLASLEVLDLKNCYRLEGKCIDSTVRVRTLKILHIAGSKLLEKRWEKIQARQCNQSLSCAVQTGQGFSNEENLLKQFQSELDGMLTHGKREPLNISGLPLHTQLLVMFDGQQEFRPAFPLPLLEESIDDIQTHFQMVYFGNHFKKLPEKVADKILGHAPANGDAKAFFQKLLSLVVHDTTDFDGLLTSSFPMTAEIVSGEKGEKYLSSWKLSDEKGVEDFVVTKCGRYLKLKQLAERPGGSPIALLTELFRGGKEEISISLLKNKDGESTKVGVDELKGKTILLDIRPANTCCAIPLQALVDMYGMEKEKFGFEIITVPMMQDNSKWDVSEWDVSVKFSSEVPWLVLENPWQLTNAAKCFLVGNYCPEWNEGWNEGWDSWYPNTMRIIKSDGAIAPYRDPGVLRMVNTWGAAAYPFTAEKEEELIQKEKTQMEAMSDAMFLFQHLERVAEQVREATRQQKMIWLFCCHEKEFTNSMKDVLTELSDIIYIIYIPDLGQEEGQWAHFTLTMGRGYSSLEPSKMSAVEMPKMPWLSLSEYEATRFWARIYSLENITNFEDKFQLSWMIFENHSWMFIMDEDGNLITREGKEIVKLLSKYYLEDRVKELMQQLLKGNSWKKTLVELEEMRVVCEESDGEDSEESDGEDSEESESDGEDSEESYSEESYGEDSEESESDGEDSEESDGQGSEGDDVFREN